jgi:hypothetical protein
MKLPVRMAWHSCSDGQRSGRFSADSKGRNRMCNARIRGPLLHRDECCACILDVFPRRMLLEERAGRVATEGVRSLARNHHAGRLVRRAGAQEPVVRQVLGARTHLPLPQEGHADVPVEGFGHRR